MPMLCLTKRYRALDKWVRLYLHFQSDYFVLKSVNNILRLIPINFNSVWILSRKEFTINSVPENM